MLFFRNQRAICHHPHPNPRLNQRGVVLIMVLFMVAIVATLSYVMMARLTRDTERTSLVLHNAQAEFYAQGSLSWALDQLQANWDKQKADQLVDKIPIKSQVDVVNGYAIHSEITDVQGRFNVNSLTEPEAQVGFKRLLETVIPNFSANEARDLISAIYDWITPSSGTNTLNEYYLNLPTPYRAAHRLMVHISELKMVKGMTPVLYEKLQPYLCALPEMVPINVQTAEAPVLLTLSPLLTKEDVAKIVNVRKQKPFLTPEQFKGLEGIGEKQIPKEIVTVSRYFLVESQVEIADQHIALYTLVKRAVVDEKATLSIVWQSKVV